ncbi:RNA polymerase sigma factor [Euzebya tangerina]|uniref:RNA polymerase sigma factor n=1 Tax=Euzebya tangerina TaxID=591198 RepID=UPI000E320113|nr:sigma-70 family RNA polymerase sigma factor [Euzebya tangerina]
MTETDTNAASPSTSGLIDRAATAFDAYRSGDRGRMGELVDLLAPILWHTARSQGLSQELAEDVIQTAWLRLVDHADRIEDSRRVLAWLMTTVKREAWSAARKRGKQTIDLDHAPEPESDTPTPEAVSLLSEQQEILWRHISALSERCAHLLRVIAFAERPDYAGIAEALDMPIGSIGPTRGRCLQQLRRALTDDTHWGGHHA